MKNRIFIPTILLFVLISCTGKSDREEKISEEKYSSYLEKGDKISNLAQGVLLRHVGEAIQQGGPEYAVEFCNLQAASITDSLNEVNNCIISRVSAKNRNPENELSGQQEKQLWNLMAEKAAAGNAHDTLLADGNSLVYYKPIKTKLPACLKCHGTPEQDINQATLQKINELYPNDKATGYALNDFRGMWKIRFEE